MWPDSYISLLEFVARLSAERRDCDLSHLLAGGRSTVLPSIAAIGITVCTRRRLIIAESNLLDLTVTEQLRAVIRLACRIDNDIDTNTSYESETL